MEEKEFDIYDPTKTEIYHGTRIITENGSRYLINHDGTFFGGDVKGACVEKIAGIDPFYEDRIKKVREEKRGIEELIDIWGGKLDVGNVLAVIIREGKKKKSILTSRIKEISEFKA
ncbi:MAG TPA: hypothetical protein VJH65_03050 [Candidatus Nanoarchaeia archaeon]|nr:hypothetical protein [Candidatus Nanoarchaeia archaeon]